MNSSNMSFRNRYDLEYLVTTLNQQTGISQTETSHKHEHILVIVLTCDNETKSAERISCTIQQDIMDGTSNTQNIRPWPKILQNMDAYTLHVK